MHDKKEKKLADAASRMMRNVMCGGVECEQAAECNYWNVGNEFGAAALSNDRWENRNTGTGHFV
jgi:hypothetical protein